MNRVTLSDVRGEAFDIIQKLKSKEVDVKTAQEIRGLLSTIIDTAKTEVDFLKTMPDDVITRMSADEIKTVAATLHDKDAELDLSLKEIEIKRNHYEHDNNK